MKKLKTGRARVIKISKETLFEFIYEKFIEEQSQLLEVEPTEVSDRFELNFADGDFIFAAWRDEDPEGNFLPMPGQIDLRRWTVVRSRLNIRILGIIVCVSLI